MVVYIIYSSFLGLKMNLNHQSAQKLLGKNERRFKKVDIIRKTPQKVLKMKNYQSYNLQLKKKPTTGT